MTISKNQKIGVGILGLLLLAGALCYAWWLWRTPQVAAKAERDVAVAEASADVAVRHVTDAEEVLETARRQTNEEVAKAYEEGVARGRALSADAVVLLLRDRIARVRSGDRLPVSGDSGPASGDVAAVGSDD